MAYTAKTWVDNSAPSVCAANLNDLETGVANAHTTADAAVGKGVLQAKGDLIGALSASSPTRVVVGADDTVLVADSAQTHGLKWVQIGNAQVLAAAAIAYSKLNLAGSIVNADVAAGAAVAYSKLAIADGDLTAAKVAGTALVQTLADAKGDLIVASVSDSFTRLAVGSNAQVLTADSVCAVGVKWAAAAGGSTQKDYVQITSTVSVTTTAEGSAITVITGTSQAYDAVAHDIEFWSPRIDAYAGAGIGSMYVVVLRGTTVIGRAEFQDSGSGNENHYHAGIVRCQDTPPASTFSYVVKAYLSAASTGYVQAGAGGATTLLPAFLKVTKI